MIRLYLTKNKYIISIQIQLYFIAITTVLHFCDVGWTTFLEVTKEGSKITNPKNALCEIDLYTR